MAIRSLERHLVETYRQELEQLRDELLARTDRTFRHLHERSERASANFSDQSQELSNEDVVRNLDVEGREELRLVEQALARIKDDTFGRCTECGKDIQSARLEAIPFTPFCVGCAQGKE